jgi:hypothetical protein
MKTITMTVWEIIIWFGLSFAGVGVGYYVSYSLDHYCRKTKSSEFAGIESAFFPVIALLSINNTPETVSGSTGMCTYTVKLDVNGREKLFMKDQLCSAAEPKKVKTSPVNIFGENRILLPGVMPNKIGNLTLLPKDYSTDAPLMFEAPIP